MEQAAEFTNVGYNALTACGNSIIVSDLAASGLRYFRFDAVCWSRKLTVTVFLSAVSREFHEQDTDDSLVFESYRNVLAKWLRRLGPTKYNVVIQEEFAQGPGDLLNTLDVEVQQSTIIVHLVGNAAGFSPEPTSVRRLHERYPHFLAHEPELRAAVQGLCDISYTQWEFYLARHHRKEVFVFIAAESAPRSPKCRDCQLDPSQLQHIRRLKADKHYDYFDDQQDLTLKVVSSIVRFGLGASARDQPPTRAAIEAARQDPSAIAVEIVESIRNSDILVPGPIDSSNVDVYLRAIDTAALKRELDRRTTLEIVHSHREDLRQATAMVCTPERLRSLAFVELAMGNYPRAMEAARRCAEVALEQMVTKPESADRYRELALNAYFLLHDSAAATGRRNEAIAALEKGGCLIDRHNAPVLWADYYQSLAKFLLTHALYDRAKVLIDEIIDIREEFSPEQPPLAGSLLLWCSVLLKNADYSGTEAVASRAARIFERQTPSDLAGVSAAISWQADALMQRERFSEAEPLLRRAAAIDEHRYGIGHPKVARSLNNLASLLVDIGNLEEPELIWRRILEILENTDDTSTEMFATCLGNLAALLMNTNRIAEAEPMLRRGLTIDEELYGESHPRVALKLSNIGVLLSQLDRHAESEPLYRRALAIDQQFYSSEHPRISHHLSLLAVSLCNLGRFEEAEPMFRRAIAIDEKFYEPDNRRLSANFMNLMSVLINLERSDEVDSVVHQSVKTFYKFGHRVGQEHPHTQNLAAEYPELLKTRGLSDEEIAARLEDLQH